MKAVEANFVGFLKDDKQFVIPIYQRSYSWSIKQCDQLWQDIERLAKDPSITAHFIGSIVYIKDGAYQVSSVPKLLVIDGQQRLTTLTLFLLAMTAVTDDEEEKRRIINYYLINRDEDGQERYRLLLTRRDKETLSALVDRQELPTDYSNRIVQNYQFFEEKIKSFKGDPALINDAIRRLIIVDVALERARDNPQLIFESLNSTGLDLSQADLIRNYVLMGLQPKQQDDLYEHTWYPMEQSFGDYERSKLFDRFIRDYLTIKTGRIPNIDQVYDAFKAYVHNQRNLKVSEILEDIYSYSRIFTNLSYSKFTNKGIRDAVDNINALRVDVTYPFLLEVLMDLEKRVINESEVENILRLVESYVFRRAISGVPTNTLNKTFATLAKGIDRENYAKSLEAQLVAKDGAFRMPNDKEFRSQLVIKDLYNFRNRNYFLRRLENHDRKELVDVESYTIEHIMPQNKKLSEKWRLELGEADWKEIQQKYLHTAGNLTLTGYNSELSDKSFVEKRDMKGGFADSPIRLNRSLAKLDHWNETEIIKRANEIADLAADIWGIPSVDEEMLALYKPEDVAPSSSGYTLEMHQKEVEEQLWNLFLSLRKKLFSIGTDVVEYVDAKSYIRYATDESIVFIRFQKGHMSVISRIAIDEVSDPNGICEHWGETGGGEVRILFSEASQIDRILEIAEQAYAKSNSETQVVA